MTLSRLFFAWLPVGALFVIARGLARGTWVFTKWDILWRLAEAAVLTLFASLWFDSLGHGGWWLLFLFVGLLVGFPVRLEGRTTNRGPDRIPQREIILLALRDAALYVVAGGILAWRLG